MRTVPSRQPAEGWPGPSDDNDDGGGDKDDHGDGGDDGDEKYDNQHDDIRNTIMKIEIFW